MKNMEADLDLDTYCDNCPYFEEETNTIKAKTINGDEIVNVYVTCENKKLCKRLVDYLKTVQEPKVEQEPKTEGDCISRQAVIQHICKDKFCYKENCKGNIYKRCPDIMWVYDLPSVNRQEPKTGWIPVNKELPVTNDEVLVTYIVNGNYKKRFVETANCYNGEWCSVNDEYRIPFTKVENIAWRPLPKPYKESEETNK